MTPTLPSHCRRFGRFVAARTARTARAVALRWLLPATIVLLDASASGAAPQAVHVLPSVEWSTLRHLPGLIAEGLARFGAGLY